MSIEESTIGLAGIFQMAELVEQIARDGSMADTPFAASINSIFTLDAESLGDVYGGLDGIRTGLHILRREFGATGQRHPDVLRYSMGVIVLEQMLQKEPDMQEKIRLGIENIKALIDDNYEVTDNHIIARLSELYSSTLSTSKYRIQVNGNRQHLENSLNVDKVRALLLSGVRSAVLWRQKGGRRLQFLWRRGKILKTADQLLRDISTV
ncbi:MAG: high frequency lysogenization protein HflD [Pseudomonadota bacterium]